jgi:putative hemolysin
MARPLKWMEVAIYPVVTTFTALTRATERLLGRAAHGPGIDELRHIAQQLRHAGKLHAKESDILSNVLDLSTTTAADVMMPRTGIVFIPADADYDAVRKIVGDHRYTRYPVVDPEKGADEILGLIQIKDLFADTPETFDTARLAAQRPPLFVPQFKKIVPLFREMQAARGQMAVVVDEYGGTAGIVTLEDIIEEIVGEIIDEDEPLPIRRVSDQTLICLGWARLDDIEETLGLSLPDRDDVDTLAGYVFTRLGRVPEPGERLRLADGTQLIVRELDGPKITRIQITLPGPTPGSR